VLGLGDIDIQDDESELLLLFKTVVDLEGLLEVRVQVVLHHFSLAHFGPAALSVVPLEELHNRVAL